MAKKTDEIDVLAAATEARRAKKAAQNAAARRQAATNRANGVIGNGHPDANRRKDALRKEREERRARQHASAEAWASDKGVQAIRDELAELEATTATSSATEIRRLGRLTQLRGQLAEIAELLAKYGEKSGTLLAHDGRTRAIKALRASNGYLGRIVRDALFGAHRRLRAEIVREGDAA